MLYYILDNNYIFINQNYHGKFAGELAKYLKDDCYIDSSRKNDLIFALYNHDRAWIDMDNTPLWNDGDDKPYSFMDYPNSLRLTFYKKGLDEVEESNTYASILCSLHYQSLMKNSKDERIKKFIISEENRVSRLKDKLNIDNIEDKILNYNLSILQFFDNLSLYTCLQEGKTESEEKFKWFKDGFPQEFKCMNNEKIRASWIDNKTISLDPFPFKCEFEVPLEYKMISLDNIKDKGIASAYNDAPFSKKFISFIKGCASQ